MNIYFNTDSSSYDSFEDQPKHTKNTSNSSCMPSSDAIWVQMPIRYYGPTEVKETPKQYNPNPYVSLVAKGDYK